MVSRFKVAQEILAKLIAQSKSSYVSTYDVAVVCAGLGDKEQAFQWLEKAYGDKRTFDEIAQERRKESA